MRRAVTFMCAFAMAASVASAQSTEIKIGDAVVSGSLRTRMYSWDWFGDTPNGEYTYSGSLFRFGLTESKKKIDWQVEFAVPALVGMPTTAVLPAPMGQLGLGGSYAAANSGSRNSSSIFLKQGTLRVKGIGGIAGQSLKVGRMEFIDGSEVTPGHSSLAALKRDRIAQRLLANFGFTDVQRSLDGAQYVLNMPRWNVTAVAARPTEGVFQVDGWSELKINVFYGAVTGEHGKYAATDWRVFAIGYRDYRSGVVKTDNRAAAIRNADTADISIGTYGGHVLQIVPTLAGPVDLLFWGALQYGSWGTQAHRAGAFAAEAGWQPAVLSRIKPWIRGGYDVGSGDDNAADGTHKTFFQVLPTPRIYARTPFYNMMNSRDAFGELILRPRRVTVRSDVHVLKLADTADLWYSGGGAFQAATFGYTGRPASGQSTLGTLYDVSADVTLTPHIAVGGYFGYASGGLVTQSIYSGGNAVHLAAELRRIADVADKYHVPMVKITGSQRIDLLGIRKEDLPKVWADLGMPSGQAYTKGVRMVKTCVGTDFCRFGTQDSTSAGIEMERRFEHLYTPHKVKMASVGCPRNCAEATVKDIGLVGQEGGWQVVVGGAAGKSVRKADLLITVETTDAALEAAELFFQYYREHANYLERTYDFVERLGIDKVRKETVYAPEPVRSGLLDRLRKSKAAARDAWLEGQAPVNPTQFIPLQPIETVTS